MSGQAARPPRFATYDRVGLGCFSGAPLRLGAATTFHPFDALNACSGQAFHFSPFRLSLPWRDIQSPMDFARWTLISALISLSAINLVQAQAADGDVGHGKALFQQNCSLCHADTAGPG